MSGRSTGHSGRPKSRATAQSLRDYHNDKNLIRRKLGLGPCESLPCCPARSMSKARRLASAGDLSHLADTHKMCSQCRCGHTAGMGTDHLGYGFCSHHEEKFGVQKSATIARRHRESLLAPHPGIYRDTGRFTAMIVHQGDESLERMTLHEELRIARGHIQELILAAEGRREDADGNVVNLTEWVQGEKGKELRPMSDATRISMMGPLLRTAAGIAKAEHGFRGDTSISLDQFRVWFSRVWQGLTEITADSDSGVYKTGRDVLDACKDMFKRLGEPRSVQARPTQGGSSS